MPGASERAQLLAGIRAELPLALSVMPFGLIFGVLALDAGLRPAQAQAMSSIVFAGSAQFIGVQLIGSGTPLLVLWLTTFVVNLRHLLYSASLLRYVGHLPFRWRALLAYLLTDEAYVVTILHYQDQGEASQVAWKHWFYLGTGVTLWGCWQISTAAGVFLGARVPAGWSLDFTLALTFIGIVVPTVDRRPALWSALAAAMTAVLTWAWPYRLGLVAAALAGIVVGTVLEEKA